MRDGVDKRLRLFSGAVHLHSGHVMSVSPAGLILPEARQAQKHYCRDPELADFVGTTFHVSMPSDVRQIIRPFRKPITLFERHL